MAKIHHALVDGRSAVEVAKLLFDVTPDEVTEPAGALGGRPRRCDASGHVGRRAGAERVAARRASAWRASPADPRARRRAIDGTLRRSALAAGDDLLRPAPALGA